MYKGQHGILPCEGLITNDVTNDSRTKTRVSVSWHFKDHVISAADYRFEKTEDGLILRKVELRDAGQYRCEAQVGNVTISMTTRLIVHCKYIIFWGLKLNYYYLRIAKLIHSNFSLLIWYHFSHVLMMDLLLLNCFFQFILGVFHLVRTHLGVVGGVMPPIHFHCVLHAKRGWVGPTCKIAFVLNGRPPISITLNINANLPYL